MLDHTSSNGNSKNIFLLVRDALILGRGKAKKFGKRFEKHLSKKCPVAIQENWNYRDELTIPEDITIKEIR